MKSMSLLALISAAFLLLPAVAREPGARTAAEAVWPDEPAVPDPNAKATALIFVAHDCPMSNAYAPEIERLHKAFAARHVAFRIVYAERSLSPAAMAAHAKEFALTCPAILDAGLTLAARIGATMTPQAALLSPTGDVLYLGRIDDIYADYGQRRMQPTERNLHDAIEAVLAGCPVPRPRTPALGCHIDFAPRSQPVPQVTTHSKQP